MKLTRIKVYSVRWIEQYCRLLKQQPGSGIQHDKLLLAVCSYEGDTQNLDMTHLSL